MIRNFTLVVLLSTASALSYAGTVSVPGTSDIWLAGQPNGSSVTGNFGTDTLAANAPILVSVTAGQTLTFSAAGSTTVDGSCFAGPDGGCYADESGFGVGPANGIGTYKGPSDALIGVFLTNATPSGTNGPASADFTGSNNFTSLSPQLDQIFFIGDGLTGTGTGAAQQFIVPAGATRLYLAVADSLGGSNNNSGSLSVTMTPLATAPEPGTFVFFSIAVAGIFAKRVWAAKRP